MRRRRVGSYYNETGPFAAQWLRELIKSGSIAPGDVDERSIEDVRPVELLGYRQHHFFAGIGVWSHALRRAGWPDEQPVVTASCPCQPFSAAGARAGFADERHLWPALHWLLEELRPRTVFGEQVSGKAAEPWLDAVQDDLETLGYAFGACSFTAASVGAANVRQRTYWVADSIGKGSQRWLSGRAREVWEVEHRHTGCSGPIDGADWVMGKDGRSRPIESGTFPLVDVSASGVGRGSIKSTPEARAARIKGYVNALNAEAATVFIESFLEA